MVSVSAGCNGLTVPCNGADLAVAWPAEFGLHPGKVATQTGLNSVERGDRHEYNCTITVAELHFLCHLPHP